MTMQSYLRSSEKEKGFVYITRRLVFSSAHRLHHPDLDNKTFYGQCANLHGHNYILEVTVKGKVTEQTGFVVDLKELKEVLEKEVKVILDHKNLDKDINYFENVVQSAENIAIFIWKRLENKLPKNAILVSIRLHETENNIVEYFG